MGGTATRELRERPSADSVCGRLWRLVLAVGLTVLGASNASKANGGGRDPHPLVPDDFIKLSTTHCRGTCPVYTVSISRTGKVLYSGDSCVAVSGGRSTQFTKAEMKHIQDALSDLHVFTSPPVCIGCRIKDVSFYEVDVRSKGKFARLTAATHLSAPIAPLLESILQGEVKKWVGKPRLK